MAKIKNVVPYVVGIGTLVTGVCLIKKKMTSQPKQVTLTIPKEYDDTGEFVKKPELVALEQTRNYIELGYVKSKAI